jgi:uncharacterized membrane protein YdbT with pleckstrin-like domain
MAFPRKLLGQNEQLILDIRPHWIALAAPVLLILAVLVGLVLALLYIPSLGGVADWVIWLGAIVILVAWPVRWFIAWITSHFVVTSDRVIHRYGWFAKHSMEIPLENINDVRFGQSAFERMVGAGDLRIESAGEFGQNVFTDIRHPERVQKLIFEVGQDNQDRMMRGGRPASTDSASVADELRKLDQLRADGVLSEDEFRAQKARLLGSSS